MPTATVAEKATTNKEFAGVVGCHHSMASRIRSGQRLPGKDLKDRIATAYGINAATANKAFNAGSEQFGELVRNRCFIKAAAAPAPAPAKKVSKSTKKSSSKK